MPRVTFSTARANGSTARLGNPDWVSRALAGYSRAWYTGQTHQFERFLGLVPFINVSNSAMTSMSLGEVCKAALMSFLEYQRDQLSDDAREHVQEALKMMSSTAEPGSDDMEFAEFWAKNISKLTSGAHGGVYLRLVMELFMQVYDCRYVWDEGDIAVLNKAVNYVRDQVRDAMLRSPDVDNLKDEIGEFCHWRGRAEMVDDRRWM